MEPNKDKKATHRRIGGDATTHENTSEILATRLQQNLEARNRLGNRRYELSLNVGIANYDPKCPCSIDELLARADRLMYEQRWGKPKS